MRRVTSLSCLVLLVITSACLAAEPAASLDIRHAVPADAHLVIYGRHNPERDYQSAYLQDIWKTVEDERLFERLFEHAIKIVTSRMQEDDLENAKSVLDDLKAALDPIDWGALANLEEIVYAQVMEIPVDHHFVLLRLSPETAASCETSLKNLFAMLERYSGGGVPVQTTKEGAVEITKMGLPEEVPFRPCFARLEGVLVIATSESIAQHCLSQLQGGREKSKFDDPRLKEALANLPEPEDSLIFFDGRQLFERLRGLGPFIQKMSHGDSDAERVVQLIDLLLEEADILDYEATVEYTEAHRNRSMAFGKLLPGANEKLLVKMLDSGKPFDDWQQWIPEDAVSYSLSTGVNLHPLYEWLMEKVPVVFPEAQDGLDQFEHFQKEIGVHLDQDILQAFSGECVSIAFPPSAPSPMGGMDSVLALRCQKPERIRELLHELVDRLLEIPAVRTQQLKLVECEELEGFEELSASFFAIFSVKPVIGFHDGWLMIGSSANAVKKVIDTQTGKSPGINKAKVYEQFGLEIEGPVASLRYENLAENTRQAAQFLQKAGAIAPMILGMIGAQADAEEMEVIQEILGLLPSIAKIVGKFDYLEQRLRVTQEGDAENTYVTRSVTLVRPPAESQPGEAVGEQAETATP
ncbi:MAG: hypothetical protein JW829_06655 [Pirellulales bacterium]|nr:hypothetical protein [Pirellulales bacterium]